MRGADAGGRVHIAALVLALLTACSFDVDPNGGRFSCDTSQDCGKGYECIDQVGSERGLCFPLGECDPDETKCDAQDDDCNGAVDDVNWDGEACLTGSPGVCAPGTRHCVDAQSVCTATIAPSAEVCDGLDNDCDGQVDEDFTFATDNQHCGGCGIACPSGTTCRFALCVETNCANALDDDGDLAADCGDVDCLAQPCEDVDGGRVCGLVPPEWVDAGADGGDPDGGQRDGGEADGGANDAGGFDGGDPDAGSVDAGDSDGGSPDGGDVDGGSPDGGVPPVPACVPREALCDDGVDQDGDGATDCSDPDCDAQPCGDAGTCALGVCQ